MREIDADKLKEEFEKNEDDRGNLTCDWLTLINNAPTLLQPSNFEAGYDMGWEDGAGGEEWTNFGSKHEKLTDISEVKRAMAEIIQRTWDRGYKLGRLRADGKRPEASWIIKEISNGFGTFKRRTCDHCGHTRAQMPVTFCGYCGYHMVNASEVEEEDGTRIGG